MIMMTEEQRKNVETYLNNLFREGKENANVALEAHRKGDRNTMRIANSFRNDYECRLEGALGALSRAGIVVDFVDEKYVIEEG